ncbi:MAG: hypothetical protein EZS28_017428, partial [Streblomastix strix]
LRVIIHGILHLCGMNDKESGEREIMEKTRKEQEKERIKKEKKDKERKKKQQLKEKLKSEEENKIDQQQQEEEDEKFKGKRKDKVKEEVQAQVKEKEKQQLISLSSDLSTSRLSTEKPQIPINIDDIIRQLNQQEKKPLILPFAEIEKQSAVPLLFKVPQKSIEKGIFRVSNLYSESQISRRFGIVAEGSGIFNNVPIIDQDFRAITVDDKDGIIRLGWHEQLKWDLALSDKSLHWVTLEIDLREEMQHNTVRLFIGNEESPIIFVNVPKKLKIYLSYGKLSGTTNKLQLFEILKQRPCRQGGYTKIIDYNTDLKFEKETRERKSGQ